MERLKKIMSRQFDFQKLLGWPIDSDLENDRNELSEKYIFKMVEECVELRKEAPSVMNPWEKNAKDADMERIRKEMSDVFLFFLNTLLIWRVEFEDLLTVVEEVQDDNFTKVKEKMLRDLNDEILQIPGYTSGIGSGNSSPKYVFVGQNPGKNILHGYRFWSNKNDGSSKILLPALEKKELLKKSYFTNLVKCTTLDNQTPNEREILFWKKYFDQEIEILRTFNSKIKLIAMGNWTYEMLNKLGITSIKIIHPSYYLRRGLTFTEYEERELKNV